MTIMGNLRKKNTECSVTSIVHDLIVSTDVILFPFFLLRRDGAVLANTFGRTDIFFKYKLKCIADVVTQLQNLGNSIP